MDIGTVINNVGMTYERPSYFHDVCNNATFVTSMINLNVVAVTAMTRILLPKMLEREKGVFVNVGSAVSYIGVPFFSLYSASKCYMEELTLDLAEEYADKGIIFQYQAPGYVTTKIAKIKETSFGIPNPEQYARAGLRSVGLQQATSIWPSQRLFAAAGSVLLTIGGKELLRSMAYSVGYTFWLYAKKREIEKTKFDNVV
jgi:17beta-estradiol 17-dehydrogenase / very-long-chain 3-oxoacyl-CoA reductase